VIIGNDGGVAVSWDQTRTWKNFIPNLRSASSIT